MSHQEQASKVVAVEQWSIGSGIVGRAEFVRLRFGAGANSDTHAADPSRHPDSPLDELLRAGIPKAIAAELLGFEAKPQIADEQVPGSEETVVPTAALESEEPEEPVEPAPPLWRVVGPYVNVTDENQGEIPDWYRQGQTLQRLGSKPEPPIPPRPLIPASRLGCLLRQHLTRLEPSRRLDEPKLVSELAVARQLGRLPMLARKTWPHRVQVHWDTAPATSFAWYDQNRAVEWLERWVGSAAIECCFTDGITPAVRFKNAKRLAPTPLEPNTSVLALSDLGASDGHQGRLRHWAELGKLTACMGSPSVALVLAPHSHWAQGYGKGWKLAEWEPARASLRDPTDEPSTATSPAELLITLLAPTLRIEPGLLREARDLLSHHGATYATELAVWLDPRIETRSREGAALSAKARRELRPEYLALGLPLRRAFEELLTKHHDRLSPLLLAEELMACARDPAELAPGEIDPPYQAAQTIWEQYARSLGRSGIGSPSEDLYHERMAPRQPKSAWGCQPLATAWGLAHLNSDRSDFTSPTPEGLDTAQISFLLEQHGQLHWVLIWQLGQELHLEPVAQSDAPPPHPRGHVLAKMPLKHDQLVLRWQSADALQPQSGIVQISDCPTLRLDGTAGSQLKLETDLATLSMLAEGRPDWAKAIRRDREGLWLKTEVLEFDWIEGAQDTTHDRASKQAKRQIKGDARLRTEPHWRGQWLRWPEWAERIERDEHGMVAFLPIAPKVEMRLRWIPPVRFLMGSPSDEQDRSSDEGPQHWVRLSSGLWLAETACTQEQWVAVMGENPSHFKNDPHCPVEQVSWDDCQSFCKRLSERFPNLLARLPTEAEWEYACRAGTTNAFNDGSDCASPQDEDPALDKLGWYRENSGERTHPVGEKEPNAWGLHDMHGNVYEWCMDRYGDYAQGEQQNPQGAIEGQFRVFRGGSWSSQARGCRSAYRRLDEPGGRGFNLGFRLAAVQFSEQTKKASEP